MPSNIDRTFILEFFAKTIATLIGVFVALYFNRKAVAKNEMKEKKLTENAKLKRQIQLLQMLRGTIQKNRGLIQQMQNEVSPTYIIFYNVDLPILESTTVSKFEIFDDIELIEKIDTLRYELTHLSRKIDMQFNMQYSGIRLNEQLYQIVHAGITTSIKSHLPHILNQTNNIIDSIDKKLTFVAVEL